ncbi:hypothetical protein BC831DRAFT_550199 [Entophlyctis helioformis]|nr:hypothetical protein BC831DRAFT_550199 [Entophlyctis helioformis]
MSTLGSTHAQKATTHSSIHALPAARQAAPPSSSVPAVFQRAVADSLAMLAAMTLSQQQPCLQPAAIDTLAPWLVSRFPTGHSANIFSAMLMPSTANSVVASAAGDGRVRIFDVHWSLGSASPKPRSTFTCFTDRAKRLALEPGNPYLLWACSEDGTVHHRSTASP